MSRQEANKKVWTPNGSESQMHTSDNARDLVMHAGWHFSDPKVAAIETIRKANEILGDKTTSFDDKAEEEAPKVEVKKVEVKKEEAKKDNKPSKPARG
jgi:hypothetical protein